LIVTVMVPPKSNESQVQGSEHCKSLAQNP